MVRNWMEQLHDQQGLTVAVINNEFADAPPSLDNSAADPNDLIEDFIELANGCVCCSIKSDFISALETLLKRKKFDYVLVECSGAVDPAPLASMFWVDEELDLGVHLDSIVCVVDAYCFPRMISLEKSSIQRQIAYADRVVVNKSDLVSTAQLAQVVDQARGINSLAKCTSTTRGVCDIADLLFIKAYSVDGNLDLQVSVEDPHANCTAGTHACGTETGLGTIVLESTSRVKLSALNAWMATILWEEHSFHIYRMKGIFSAVSGTRHVLQVVGDIFEVSDALQAVSCSCRIVIIGRDLDTASLRQGFHQILSA